LKTINQIKTKFEGTVFSEPSQVILKIRLAKSKMANGGHLAY